MAKTGTNNTTKPTAVKKKGTGKGPKKSGGSGGIGGPQRILNFTLSQATLSGDPSVSRKTIASLSGVKASTFAVTISNMKKQGLIEYDKDTIRLTEAGRAKADATQLPTAPDNATLQEELKKQYKVGGKQAALFDAMTDGKVYDRATLTQEIGYTNKNSLAVALSTMKKQGLIVYDRTTIQLSDNCFPFGRPE